MNLRKKVFGHLTKMLNIGTFTIQIGATEINYFR